MLKYYDVEILIGAVPFSELEDEGDFAEISITYLIFDESRNQNGLFALALELYPEQCPEEEKMLFEKVNDLVKAHGKEYKSNDQELRDILKDISQLLDELKRDRDIDVLYAISDN